MDLAIGVAIGSSLQIALLVLPLMVLFSWWGLGAGNGPELTLAFDGFQVSVLFIGIVLVNYLIQDGKSHWLEGQLHRTTAWQLAVMGGIVLRMNKLLTYLQVSYSKSSTPSSQSRPSSIPRQSKVADRVVRGFLMR